LTISIPLPRNEGGLRGEDLLPPYSKHLAKQDRVA
jgi:hypothetical protein